VSRKISLPNNSAPFLFEPLRAINIAAKPLVKIIATHSLHKSFTRTNDGRNQGKDDWKHTFILEDIIKPQKSFSGILQTFFPEYQPQRRTVIAETAPEGVDKISVCLELITGACQNTEENRKPHDERVTKIFDDEIAD
jgi:hypothetical protein